MTDKITTEPYPILRLSTEPASIVRLTAVLQSGFFRRAVQGQTLLSFLSSLPGFTSDYIANRLQTIFLNGDSVDDMELSFSGNTAVLALSAAMPGLAGSLFRKCSPLTALRKTAVQEESGISGSPVEVQVKFFNVIAVEKGCALLAEGAVLNSGDLMAFLELRPTLSSAITAATLDAEPLSPEKLPTCLKACSKILLICKSTDG